MQFSPSPSLLLPGATLLFTESLRLEKTYNIMESDLLGKTSIMERVVEHPGCPGKCWDHIHGSVQKNLRMWCSEPGFSAEPGLEVFPSLNDSMIPS